MFLKYLSDVWQRPAIINSQEQYGYDNELDT